jgi:ribosomal protein L29
MKYKELKKKKEIELQEFISQSHEKLRELRFKDASKQLKNVREIRQNKQMIAQGLTIMSLRKKGLIKEVEEPKVANPLTSK